MELYQHDAGQMTKVATMRINGKKKIKNLIPWNQRTDFGETWYVASGTMAHQRLFKL